MDVCHQVTKPIRIIYLIINFKDYHIPYIMFDVITRASALPSPTYFLMDLINDCHEQQEDARDYVRQNRYPIIKGRKPLKAECGMNPKIHDVCSLD
jgi:hypothetical protein